MKGYKRMNKKELEHELNLWLSFMENGKLRQRFREYSAAKINEIEVYLLD